MFRLSYWTGNQTTTLAAVAANMIGVLYSGTNVRLVIHLAHPDGCSTYAHVTTCTLQRCLLTHAGIGLASRAWEVWDLGAGHPEAKV